MGRRGRRGSTLRKEAEAGELVGRGKGATIFDNNDHTWAKVDSPAGIEFRIS